MGILHDELVARVSRHVHGNPEYEFNGKVRTTSSAKRQCLVYGSMSRAIGGALDPGGSLAWLPPLFAVWFPV